MKAKEQIDYKKEYNRIYQEVAKMLVDNRRNYKTPMTPFELLSNWDKIREVKKLTLTDVVVSEAECCDICKEESMKGNKVNKICTNCIKENY